MANKKEDKRSPLAKHAGLLFVAMFFLGLGFGALLGQPGAGALLGLGAGFLAMYWGYTRK